MLSGVVRRLNAFCALQPLFDLIDPGRYWPKANLRRKAAVAIIAGLACAAAVRSGHADDARYFYDPAGRLTGVLDPVNGSAQYNYDAVGNITSVVRRATTDLFVAQVSPSRGRAGDVVTIFGTGFGTAADTTVSFNGQAAAPLQVEATQIRVAVPSGAVSGPITVSSPAGTASLVGSFTVVPFGAPIITGVSPSMIAAGATITLSGSDFDPVLTNNKVLVNGRYAKLTAATSTALTAFVTTATSGHVTVMTPEGTGISSGYLVVPPPPYATSDIETVAAGALGASATVSVGTSGHVGLLLFDATAGQRVAMQVTSSSFGGASLSLLGPDGAAIMPATAISTGKFLDVEPLASAGTYTLLLAPGSNQTGSATISLINVPPDVTGAILADANPVALTNTVPGQNMSLSFAGSAGQRIALLLQNSAGLNDASGCCGGCSSILSLVAPDGSTVYSNGCSSSGSAFSDTKTLPATGNYRINYNPGGMLTGTATFTLYNVPPDITASISADATSAVLTTTSVGQNMQLTFSGTAGQRVTLRLQNSSGLNDATGCCGGCSSSLSMTAPNGSIVYSNGCSSSSGWFSDVLVLPSSGPYTIFYNPGGFLVGTATFTLTTLPPDASGTISTNGTAVSLTTTVAGQNMSLTFLGSAGQRINFGMQNGASLNDATGCCGGCSSSLSVSTPGGATLFNTGCASGSSVASPVLTLPETGTYVVSYNPGGLLIGTATFTITTVISDVVGSIGANGTPVALTTTVANQNMSLSLSGAAGQRIYILLQNSAGLNDATGCCGGCSSSLTLKAPSGSTVYSATCASSASLLTDVLILPAAGTYTLYYDPGGSLIGTATFTINTVPADASATITAGGGSVSLSTTSAHQNMSLSFSGTAGQRISLFLQNGSGLNDATGCCGGCSSQLRVLTPSGATLYSTNCASASSAFTDVLTLSATGTYSIAYNPGGTLFGTATFTLYDVPPDVTGSANVGDAAVNYMTTAPGQAIQVSFAGVAGQSVSVTVGVVSAVPAAPCYNITTRAPGGSIVRGDQSCSANYTSGALTLSQTGTYTVLIDPSALAVGTFSARVGSP